MGLPRPKSQLPRKGDFPQEAKHLLAFDSTHLPPHAPLQPWKGQSCDLYPGKTKRNWAPEHVGDFGVGGVTFGYEGKIWPVRLMGAAAWPPQPWWQPCP